MAAREAREAREARGARGATEKLRKKQPAQPLSEEEKAKTGSIPGRKPAPISEEVFLRVVKNGEVRRSSALPGRAGRKP